MLGKMLDGRNLASGAWVRGFACLVRAGGGFRLYDEGRGGMVDRTGAIGRN